jgi:hypothetical protein
MMDECGADSDNDNDKPRIHHGPLSSETLNMFLDILYLVTDLQPKASVTHTRTHAHVPAHAEAEAAMAA